MLTARVSLMDKMKFRGEAGSGHTVIMDAAEQFGGENAGARPMELLLIALGACTGMDVISILRKKRQEVTSYEIVVNGERADEDPRVFTTINVEHIVRGKGMDASAVGRAVGLSTDKYCPVIATLARVAEIQTSFRVEEG